MDKSLVRDKYFILLINTKGYILKPDVFKAPEKIRNKELQRGTMLEEQLSEDPQRRTFAVTDQKEVHFDCRIESTASKLTEHTDGQAELLLKILSLEERWKKYQSFVLERSKEQHQTEVEDRDNGKEVHESSAVHKEGERPRSATHTEDGEGDEACARETLRRNDEEAVPLRERLKEKKNVDLKLSRKAKYRELPVDTCMDLRRRLEETRKQLEEEQDKVKVKDRELRNAKSRFDNLNDIKKQLKVKNEELDLNLSKKEERINKLQEDLKKSKQRSNELKTKIKEQEADLSSKNKELRRLRRRTQQLVIDAQRKRKEISLQLPLNLQEQMRVREKRLRNQLKLENDEKTKDLRKQLDEKEGGLNALHGSLEEKENENGNLRRELEETRHELLDLQERFEEQLPAQQRRVTELESQLRTNEHELASTTEQMNNLNEQLLTSEGEKETLQEHFRRTQEQNDQLHSQLQEVEERLRRKDREYAALQEQLRTEQQSVARLQRGQQVGRRNDERVVGERRSNESPPDWIINRNEIEVTNIELGRGGWGRVVQGKFRRCDVAVKEIHNLIISDYNRGSFEREVSMAARCRHPCLLQFIGATNDERSPLIITELMETSLRAQLQVPVQQRRHLSATDISNISLDVARALNYLHQKRPQPIIHRDISSANVLLWRQGVQGVQWRGKVSDYGTANFARQCTSAGPGAPIYSAPEIVGGAHNQIISCKVDVYSFGVLLCEMYIRELPDPERRNQQIDMVTNHARRDLIRRCVRPEPGLRSNMEGIIDELDASI